MPTITTAGWPSTSPTWPRNFPRRRSCADQVLDHRAHLRAHEPASVHQAAARFCQGQGPTSEEEARHLHLERCLATQAGGESAAHFYCPRLFGVGGWGVAWRGGGLYRSVCAPFGPLVGQPIGSNLAREVFRGGIAGPRKAGAGESQRRQARAKGGWGPREPQHRRDHRHIKLWKGGRQTSGTVTQSSTTLR